ncbi:hypothetical protein [Paracoccus laeviglucosivorans]|uniref:Uncharacterized protein n=1 Tax=Paracoccus laeviglucosivorans TaxID=1197861 RepID=A0A521CM21_9RHOB|nr:hypothetical protein [Paracoccus laeviglucosivorans]SMO60497.1 hypothetical protein SAMN06265221_10521 [Paracoccus laeviglucosivorans]
MNNLIWLIRASRWARNPPSARMVKLVLAIIAAGLVLAGLEHLGLWPEWAELDRPRGMHLPKP